MSHRLGLPPYIFWLVVLAGLALGYGTITHLDVGIGDEDVHRFQIGWFLQGRYEIFEFVTVLPLYHLVVAALAEWSGLTSLDGMRFVHMLLAAGAIPAFLLLCRALYPAEAATRTLQFMFIPLVFPLFFLTYTDVPALMCVVLMLERTFRHSQAGAAVFALLAVLLRQPNIVWVGFACALVAQQTAQRMSVGQQLRPGDGGRGLLAVEYCLEVLRECRYLLAVFAVFGIFVLWNGGVAVGDAGQHRVTLNLANAWFCLLVAWFLFLPFNLVQLPAIGRLFHRRQWLVPLLAAAFCLYFYTYGHPHKYNSPDLDFYLHNLFIHYTSDVTALRIAAFIPVVWMALSFTTAALSSPYRAQMLLMAPFALLSFLPMPLIEPRYYLVALSLFLAMRPTVPAACTVLTLVYYLGSSACVLFGISRQLFFL